MAISMLIPRILYTSCWAILLARGAIATLQCSNGVLMSDLSMTNGNTNNWDVRVMTSASTSNPPNAIRLASKDMDQCGVIWTKTSFNASDDFYIESTVTIGNDGTTGDGVAFIFAPAASMAQTNELGQNVYGVKWNDFVGLAIYATPFGKKIYGEIKRTVSNAKEEIFSYPSYDLRNKATYQIRVASNGITQFLSVAACIAVTGSCFQAAADIALSPEISSLFQTPGLYFGVGGRTGYCVDTVDVSSVSVYACPAITTKGTSISASTSTVGPTSTPALSTSISTTTVATVVTTSLEATTTQTIIPSTRSGMSPSASSGVSTTSTPATATSGTANAEVFTATPKSTTSSSTASVTQMKTTTRQMGSATPMTSTKTAVPNTSKAGISTTTTRATTASSASVASTTTATSKTAAEEAPSVQSIIQSLTQYSSQQLQQQSFPQVEETSSSNVTATQLLNECNHFSPTRAAPPVNGNGSVTWVQPLFAADRLVEIDTVGETISVAGMMLLKWSVTTCPADTADQFTSRAAEQVYVTSADEIWVPAYRYINTATSTIYMKDNRNDFGEDLLATTQDGWPNRSLSFFWLKDGLFTSSCQLYLARFPFDKQTCIFSFSLVRSVSLVAFVDPRFFWPDNAEKEGGEWNYQGYEKYITEMFYKGQQTSTVHYGITFQRNPGYYISSSILPNVVLMIVEIGSFMLPPKVPDRPAFSVTVLLAMTVSQSTVMSQIPKTSQRILLVDFVGALSWLCAACTLYHALTCCYEHCKTKKEQKHRCLKRFGGITRVCDLVAVGLLVAAFVGMQFYFKLL